MDSKAESAEVRGCVDVGLPITCTMAILALDGIDLPWSTIAVPSRCVLLSAIPVDREERQLQFNLVAAIEKEAQ